MRQMTFTDDLCQAADDKKISANLGTVCSISAILQESGSNGDGLD